MTNPFIIAVVNQKGGVSKTTTTVNLGAALARRGFRVLLIDLDTQCNLTQSLIGELEPERPCIGACLKNTTALNDVLVPTGTENLYLVPAGEEMADIDLHLSGRTSGEKVLERCIKKSDLTGFDFIIIDTAPYISRLTWNALVPSTHYLVPTLAEYLPLRGIERLTRNIDRVREEQNPDLSLLGVVITQYDTRKSITARIEEALREGLGDALFQTRIRINTKFSSSPINQQTIFQYEEHDTSKGSDDYSSLCGEVLERLGVRVEEREVVNG
jgi:chromosome partitioning protein